MTKEEKMMLLNILFNGEEEIKYPKTSKAPKTLPYEEQEIGCRMDTPVPAGAIQGYSIDLAVWPTKVGLIIRQNCRELSRGYSYIKNAEDGFTMTDLMQAISYAAHMAYKNTQQIQIQGE